MSIRVSEAVSWAGKSNYIPQILSVVITCPALGISFTSPDMCHCNSGASLKSENTAPPQPGIDRNNYHNTQHLPGCLSIGCILGICLASVLIHLGVICLINERCFVINSPNHEQIHQNRIEFWNGCFCFKIVKCWLTHYWPGVVSNISIDVSTTCEKKKIPC